MIRLKRQKSYSERHRDPDQQDKLMSSQPELMISRFHALLEPACNRFAGKVILEQCKQGAPRAA